ncbi:MAG: nitroreductase family protein [Candidatus Bathyarchaeia archaeon]
MNGEIKVLGFSKDDLMKMDPMVLRAIIRERTHHTIEVLIYRILKGKMKIPESFGETVRFLLEIWKERKLPMNMPDLEWVQNYLDLALKLRKGEKISLKTKLPKPFNEKEMKIVYKLLFERRSIRQWKPEPIPEKLLREVLYAGLMAPQGCNLCSTRFLILHTPEEKRLVKSDIPVDNAVIIVVCQDMRIYRTLNYDKYVPQNIYYDAAAAADHICLMAHALGLGAVWLTHDKEDCEKVRAYFNLPDYVETRLHIAIGWPDEAPIKSQRMSLDEVMIGMRKR